MDTTKIVADLMPYCFQTTYTLNHSRLLESLNVLMDRMVQSLDTIQTRLLNKEIPWYQLNLTHLPGLTGDDRFLKYTGKTSHTKSLGISEADFSQHLREMQDLYIGQVIHDVYKQHNRKFQGRAILLWLGPGVEYMWHRDIDTRSRYHIPLITNNECWFKFKEYDSDTGWITYQIHQPIGTVWYVDPVTLEHTFANDSDKIRLHLVLTNGF
jgi:hypothetical protein